jgi:hypothetical protein
MDQNILDEETMVNVVLLKCGHSLHSQCVQNKFCVCQNVSVEGSNYWNNYTPSDVKPVRVGKETTRKIKGLHLRIPSTKKQLYFRECTNIKPYYQKRLWPKKIKSYLRMLILLWITILWRKKDVLTKCKLSIP